jgi:hypothetical protein
VIERTLLIALLSSVACFAQSNFASLIGKVTDPYGSPVEGSMVQLDSDLPLHLHFTASTDRAGEFRFADIPPGNYHLGDMRIELSAGQSMSLPSPFLDSGACGGLGIVAMQHLADGNNLGTLRGSARNSRGTGKPIVGASVSLKCAGCITTTNEAGQFAFFNLKPGTYKVTVSMVGFHRESFPDFLVAKNLDWTYWPILLDKCQGGDCGYRGQPRRPKVVYCE